MVEVGEGAVVALGQQGGFGLGLAEKLLQGGVNAVLLPCLGGLVGGIGPLGELGFVLVELLDLGGGVVVEAA